MRRGLILLLTGCTGTTGKDSVLVVPSQDDSTPPDSADSVNSMDSVDSSTDTAVCENLPEPPDTTTTYDEIAASEDFAFDREGWVVHVDDRGNLIRETQDGQQELILPRVGTAAGFRILPNGDYVIADAGTGSVVRITPEGASTVLLGGLQYPNGLDIGLDGYIYVAEQSAGRLRRIDPDTGDYEIIATDMNQPNGVSFSPDHQTVYVGSFGGGVVYAVERENDSFKRAQLYAGLEGSFERNEDMCVDLSEGDPCYRTGSQGPGLCGEDGEGGLICTGNPDTLSCQGLNPGDSCQTTLLGVSYNSSCTLTLDNTLICPAVDASRLGLCDVAWETCNIDGARGYCYDSFEDVLVCVSNREAQSAYTEDCEGKAEGDACLVLNPALPDAGSCMDYGAGNLYCIPPSMQGSLDGSGGFDAIGTDICGNLYIGEYVTGRLLRWTTSGEEPETVIDFRNFWIPNMHWGLGTGGWSKDSLYIMNRDRGGLIEVPLGIPGHPEAYQ